MNKWDVTQTDGEVLFEGSYSQCLAFVRDAGKHITKFDCRFRYIEVKKQFLSRYILRKSGKIELDEANVDCIIGSIARNGEIVNLVTVLNEPYVFWDIDHVAHARPHIKVDVMEVTYLR